MYGICGPWSANAGTASFTCDDTGLPGSALPYVIDPTWPFNSSFFSMESSPVEYVGNGSGAYFSWTANINLNTVAPTGAIITSSSIDTSGLSGSTAWDSQWGDPAQGTCIYYNSGTDNSSQVWVSGYTFWPHGGTAGCILSISGQSSLNGTVTFWMPSVSTPNAPSGAASGTIGTSYTYSTGGSTATSGDTPQYMFNWGDGTNSGWLASGTTSASHSWAAAGTYQVTATAEDAPHSVTSGASSAKQVVILPPPPTLTSVSQSGFLQGTAISVTLVGANFVAGATTVSTTNSGVAVSGVTVRNSTTLTATFTIGSSAATGPANVSVTTSGGTSGAQTITVYVPVVTWISTVPVGITLTVDGAAVPCNPYCSYYWVPGTPHTIGASTQPGGTGTQWLWYSWSDSGAASHGITASVVGASYTANFNPQYYFTSLQSPAGAGTISPASGWYNPGSSFWVTATPSAGHQLSSFSPSGYGSSYEVVMNGPVTTTANFSPFSGQSIASTPPGAALTVDGVACAAPCTFNWTAGTQHTIGTASPQAPSSGTQLIFSGWSDGGAISHTITATAGATYSASFTAQYYLTTAALPATAGSISPPSGWYNSGQVVQVTASGSSFTGFSGALAGATNPQNVTMSGPATVTAGFASNVYTATAAFSSLIVPVGGTNTVMFTVSNPSSSESPGGGQAVVRPRVKRKGPKESGFSFSDAILNGSCYSNGNSGLSLAITQAVGYVSSALNNVGTFIGTFWATFSADNSAPVPGPFVFTCSCEYDGCTLGFEPVVTVPSTPTPQITGVSPTPPWPAGATIPDLQVLGSNLQGSLTATIMWADGTSTSQTCSGIGSSCDAGSVTVPADAAGTAVVSVASSISPQSLLGGTSGGELGSNALEVEVDVAPTPTLVVTAGGTQVSPGGTIYISYAPQVPAITASLTLPGGQTVPGNAAYRLMVTFNQIIDQDGDTQPVVWAYPVGPIALPGPSASQPQTWNIPPEGNQATVNWWYNGTAQSPFQFSIFGQNPASSTALAALQATGLWMAPGVATDETNLANFCQPGATDGDAYCQNGRNAGMPLYGRPAGYGIMQTDPPPSAASIWDWTAAVAAGAAELQSKAGPASYTNATDQSAYPFWIRQYQQWQAYNALNPNAQIGPPANQQEGPNCTFTNSSVPTNSSPYWFGDAELIKQYNGLSPNGYQYLSWNNTNKNVPPAWSFVKANTQWPNYVHDVCNCMVQSACTHNNQ